MQLAFADSAVLLRLQQLFGGSINVFTTETGTRALGLRWYLSGERFRSVAAILEFDMLSQMRGSLMWDDEVISMLPVAGSTSWAFWAGIVDAKAALRCDSSGRLSLKFTSSNMGMLQGLQQALSSLGLQVNLFEGGRGRAQRELVTYNAAVTKVLAKLLDHGLFLLRSKAEMVLRMFPSRKQELRDLFAKEFGSLKSRPLSQSKVHS